MTTPNIEELIFRLQKSHYAPFRNLLDEAVAALQSKAERIAALEKEVKSYCGMYIGLADAMQYDSGKDGMEFSPEEWAEHLIKECDTLRAQLEQIAATEPVAWLIKYEYLASTENIQGSIKKFKENWFTSSLVSDDKDEEPDVLKWRNKTVEPLFTRPMPQDVTELVELLEFMWREVSMNDYAFEKLEAALSKYKGAKK